LRAPQSQPESSFPCGRVEAETARKVVQVAAVHAERPGRSRPVAAARSHRARDRLPPEVVDRLFGRLSCIASTLGGELVREK